MPHANELTPHDDTGRILLEQFGTYGVIPGLVTRHIATTVPAAGSSASYRYQDSQSAVALDSATTVKITDGENEGTQTSVLRKIQCSSNRQFCKDSPTRVHSGTGEGRFRSAITNA